MTRTTTATETHVKDSHGFVIPSAPTTRPSGKTSQALQQQHHSQERHPSTTPKVPPNRHYFDLLTKSVDSVPAPKLDLGLNSAEGKSEEQLQIQDQEEVQEQEQERPVEIVPPVNSRMMDFARKSIMQHSAVAPTSIFRKLGNKAGSQQPLTHSQARSLINNNDENGTLPQPPIISKSTIPGTAPVATKTTASKTASPQDRTTAGEPKEVTATKESVDRWEPAGDLAFKFVPVPKPTTTPAAATSAPPHVFARSVLDFSGSNEPKIQRKAALNTVTATPISNNSVGSSSSFSTSIYPNKAHQPPSSAMENRTLPPTTTTTATARVPTNVDVEMGDAGNVGSDDSQRSSPAFDLRAALRMDSARITYQLPSMIASLSPPPSPRRRPMPYSVPSANDREALRIRRMPRFKARPLNPKIFTGAGDLGVPKLQKAALTVPVSPIFSQRRRVKDVIVAERLKKEKDVLTSATAMRLKEMVEAGAVEKQKLKQQKQQQEQSGRHQVIFSGIRQPAGRVAQPRIVHHAQASRQDVSGNRGKVKDKDLGGMGGGARRIGIAGTGRGSQSAFESSLKPALATTSLVVPSVDQTRPDVDLETHHYHHNDVPTSTAAATGVSKLRRPTAGGGTTRPVPFNFATTELQRKRMLYQPTPSDYSLIATSSSSTLGAAVGNSSYRNSTNGLSLEDLMPDA
ncbi:hypothetical protein BGZ96_011029 [Linnemannia gamsii]|uniref:TPX2 C-terminal domain-containing protein n=1 Tax=Linnemannia gamsii TaxID=64522 RepID=A0ABQ7JTU3_9FUNG|nr:hypothetical protein BGZ96_011029 [Linnemannia gamsii]